MTDIAATAHRAVADKKAHGAHGAQKGHRAGAAAEGAAGLGEFAALMDSVTGGSEEKGVLTGAIGKTADGATETVDVATLPGAEVLIDPALQAQMANVPPTELPPTAVDLLTKGRGKSPDAIKLAGKAPAETAEAPIDAAATGKAATAKPEAAVAPQEAVTTATSQTAQAAVPQEVATGPERKVRKDDARVAAKTDQPADVVKPEKGVVTVSAETPTTAAGQAAVATAQSASATSAASERPAPAAAPLAQQQAAVQADQGQSNQDGAARDDGQSGNKRGASARSVVGASAATPSTTATASADSSNALRDIMQSLPPFIQAQLGSSDVSAVANAAGASTATPSTGQLLGDKVIDMGVSGQWIDRMAREISDLADGTGHSRFQLNPPNLGRIQVDLWQGDDATNLRITTETDEAARRLREGQGALEANARMASLSLGTVSVEKSSESFDQRRDQNGQQNQRQFMDFGGQPQQQAGGQAQSQSEMGQGGLNRGRSQAVIANDQQAEAMPVASRGGSSDRNVRFA